MRSRFFIKKKDQITLAEALKITNSQLVNSDNFDLKIIDVATISAAKKDEISFLHSGSYVEQFTNSSAGFCFIEEKYTSKVPSTMIGLVNKNPYFAYSQILNEFYQEIEDDFLPNQPIHQSAKIGKNVKIANGVFIGKNVEIGDNSIIGPNVAIMNGCIIGNACKINPSAVISFAKIGNNCLIHNGAKIGQDGFGFAHNAGINYKILQIGIVEIGNDVEIGANTCIDRGAIENTRIGNGVKIDNLVQIGHNVEIGDGSVIAGCVGIAGSAKIGRFVQIGGGSSIGGHISIGDGVKIAGMSGLMRDVEPMQVVAGIPALPIKKWHKINAKLYSMIEKKNEQN